MQFEVGKKYKFRKAPGWAELVISIPKANPYSRLVFMSNTGYIVHTFESGRVFSHKEYDNDVLPIEYEEPRKFKYWANVYHTGIVGSYASKGEAGKGADSGRIACVCIEGKEGDGLSIAIEED